MRLIDADDLEERAWRERLDTREKIVEMIQSAPTIVAHKSWHWIPHHIKGYIDMGLYECSYCYKLSVREYKFCPECGAKMEVEHE